MKATGSQQFLALCSTLIVYGIFFCLLWLYNRYFDGGAPVTRGDLTFVAAFMATYVLCRNGIVKHDKEKKDA